MTQPEIYMIIYNGYLLELYEKGIGKYNIRHCLHLILFDIFIYVLWIWCVITYTKTLAVSLIAIGSIYTVLSRSFLFIEDLLLSDILMPLWSVILFTISAYLYILLPLITIGISIVLIPAITNDFRIQFNQKDKIYV